MTETVRRKKTRRPAQRDNTPLIVGGVIAAVLVVAALVLVNIMFQAPPKPPEVSSGKVWGQANAPVTIEEFSDFQ